MDSVFGIVGFGRLEIYVKINLIIDKSYLPWSIDSPSNNVVEGCSISLRRFDDFFPFFFLYSLRPGVGKTTVMREIARVLSEELHKRVVC